MNRQDSSLLVRTPRLSFVGAMQRSLVAGVVLFAASNAWAFQSASPTNTNGGGGGGKLEAPEINPALIVSAAVLLVGGILIVMSRRRRAAKA